ncbi:hypothetical protein D9M70_410900 [compost metagenome]
MRNIKNGNGGAALQDLQDRVERTGLKIIGAVQHGGGGQQRQVVGAFGQQPVKEHLVQALWRKHRFGNALRRILVEIDVGRAIGKVEIGENGLGREEAGDAPGAIVRDHRRTATALCTDEGDASAQGLGIRVDEDRRNGGENVRHRHRCDHVFGNAVADELAIEPDIIVFADENHLGARVADLCKRRKLGQ